MFNEKINKHINCYAWGQVACEHSPFLSMANLKMIVSCLY